MKVDEKEEKKVQGPRRALRLAIDEKTRVDKLASEDPAYLAMTQELEGFYKVEKQTKQ